MDATLQAQDDAAAAVAVAPRVTLKFIEDEVIADIAFLNAGDAIERCGGDATASAHLLTLCILTLRNGFTVTGESACASPENFNRELGQEIAKRHAIEQIWKLEGYALRERLHAEAEAG